MYIDTNDACFVGMQEDVKWKVHISKAALVLVEEKRVHYT